MTTHNSLARQILMYESSFPGRITREVGKGELIYLYKSVGRTYESYDLASSQARASIQDRNMDGSQLLFLFLYSV